MKMAYLNGLGPFLMWDTGKGIAVGGWFLPKGTFTINGEKYRPYSY